MYDITDINWPLTADVVDSGKSSSSASSFQNKSTSQEILLGGEIASIDGRYRPPLRSTMESNPEILMEASQQTIYQEKRGIRTWTCNPYTSILLLLTTGIATLTGVYASGSATALIGESFFSASASNSLLSLRVLSEASTLLLVALGQNVLEEFKWALASRSNGMNLIHFVGLDIGTGLRGLLRLIKRSPWKYQASILLRYGQLRIHRYLLTAMVITL